MELAEKSTAAPGGATSSTASSAAGSKSGSGSSAGNGTGANSNNKQATLSRNLWVSGLSTLTRASDLKAIFSKFGKVIGAKVVTNTRTPGTRCYGYVTMSSSADASRCIENLHRTELHGRIISVERTKNEIGGSLNSKEGKGKTPGDAGNKKKEDDSGKKSGSGKGSSSNGGDDKKGGDGNGDSKSVGGDLKRDGKESNRARSRRNDDRGSRWQARIDRATIASDPQRVVRIIVRGAIHATSTVRFSSARGSASVVNGRCCPTRRYVRSASASAFGKGSVSCVRRSVAVGRPVSASESKRNVCRKNGASSLWSGNGSSGRRPSFCGWSASARSWREKKSSWNASS